MNHKRILALDPSLTCTGYAVLAVDGSPDGELVEKGLCRAKDDGTPWERIQELLTDCGSIVASHHADLRWIVVETPQTYTKGKRGKRSAATLPSYGMCVGAILAEMAAVAADSAGRISMAEVSASEWTRDAPRTFRDDHKTRRVAWVHQVYPKCGDLGSMTTAGNVADAILIGRWWVSKLHALKPRDWMENSKGAMARCGSVVNR